MLADGVVIEVSEMLEITVDTTAASSTEGAAR